MIIFKKVRYKNLLSTGNAFLEIQMDTAQSTLCHGSNGSGKSTFIEAVSFALYGKPFRKTNKPQLVNSINKKELLVEIEFSANNKEYLVRRGMKPTVFEIYENEKLLNQDAAIRDYQEILEKSVLKMNHKSFSQIVVLGSATYVPFMQLSAVARRDIIEDLLDIQVFSTMNVLLKEKVSSAKSRISENKYNIEITKEKIELQKEYLRKLKQNDQQVILDKQKIIEDQESLIEQYNASISDVQDKIDALLETISDSEKVSKKRDKYQTFESDIKLKLSKVKKDFKFYDENQNCPQCKQGINHDFHSQVQSENSKTIDEFEKVLLKISKEMVTINSRISEIHLTNKLISKHQTAISAINENTSAVFFYIKKLQKEISSLQNVRSIDGNDLKELENNQTSLAKYETEKEQLLKEKATLDIASVILKDGGIKSKIIKQYIPIINKLINKYLSQMEFVVDFNLDENFNETIKSRFRDEFSYESFSEGEKTRIDIALLFTWRAISKIRNSNNTNILILDEIGDSSLDSSGNEEFIRILQELAGDTNIFMISHRAEGIQDKFQRVIEFSKEKNFTRISQ